MMINETPVTASELIVRARYPDAKHATWADGLHAKVVILNENTPIASGSTITEAWEKAAEVIGRKVKIQDQ